MERFSIIPLLASTLIILFMEMFKFSKLCFSKKKKKLSKKDFKNATKKMWHSFIRSIFNREVMGAIVTNR
jgi:Na+-driven multidrug efflux pump